MTDFNGTTLRVTLVAPTGGFLTVEAQRELYSEWKEWLKDTDTAQAPQLFDIIGGDPIPGSQFISPSYFLRNDLGWRLQTTDADQEVNILGNLYPRDETIAMFVPRPGRQIIINLNLTANPRDVSNIAIAQIQAQVDVLYKDAGLDLSNAKTITEITPDISYDEAVGGITKEIRKSGSVVTVTRQT